MDTVEIFNHLCIGKNEMYLCKMWFTLEHLNCFPCLTGASAKNINGSRVISILILQV